MTKNISIKFLAAVVFCLLFSAVFIQAQSTVTGAISGKITDPQGAVVPNATVTVTNVGTNNTATVTTSNDGGFRATNLQPGTYSVATSVSGFSPFKQENVVVEVGQITNIEIPLSIGDTSATVEVTAEAPVINTNDNSNSTNINQTSINELPINGRRWSNFAF